MAAPGRVLEILADVVAVPATGGSAAGAAGRASDVPAAGGAARSRAADAMSDPAEDGVSGRGRIRGLA